MSFADRFPRATSDMPDPLHHGLPAQSPVRRFSFPCVRCGCFLEATDDQANRPGRCPTCGELLTIPGIDPLTGRVDNSTGLLPTSVPRTPLHAYANAGEAAPHVRRTINGAQVIVCPRCGRESPTDANACGSCQLPFTLDGAAAPLTRPNPRAGGLLLSIVACAAGSLSLLGVAGPIIGPIAIFLALVALHRSASKKRAYSATLIASLGLAAGVLSIAYHLFTLFD
jgi:DNA-directed RNA polymerase subunit RPC12/RpoP